MATSKTTTGKAPAKKAAAPSKAAPSKAAPAKATPVKKAAPKAAARQVAKVAPKPAVKVAVKPVAKKPTPTPKAPPKKVAKATSPSVAKDLDKFAKQVELFEVPATSTATPAPGTKVEVVRAAVVKETVLPSSSSKLVTGDHRDPKPSAPPFKKNGGFNKNRGQQAKGQGKGQPYKGNPKNRGVVKEAGPRDHRSNLTRRILGEAPLEQASELVESATPMELIQGVGKPANQFASEALKAIKNATPENIEEFSSVMADKMVDSFGVEAGKLATEVVKQFTPEQTAVAPGSMLESAVNMMERARAESLPPDQAAKRSLKVALSTMLTNQNQALNSPAQKNPNGLLSLTALFKRS